MNCRKVYRNLSAYHDKLLSGEKARQLEQHLRECPECVQKWREFSEIVEATGYLEVRKPSLDFNRRLLEQVTSLESTGHESYESPGSKRWPASALVLAGIAVACAVFLTFPYVKKEESHSLAQATNQISDLQEDFELSGGALSNRISANDDSLWQIFEDMDDLQTFSAEIIAREARVYRRYVLPVVDVEGESSYAGESYLLTPVSTGVVQSADVVF